MYPIWPFSSPPGIPLHSTKRQYLNNNYYYYNYYFYYYH